jgi:hypothetical protein
VDDRHGQPDAQGIDVMYLDIKISVETAGMA